MSKYAKVASAALSALVLTTVMTQAGNRLIGTNKASTTPIRSALPACEVAGTPSEFPNDIRIFNKGFATLNAGTKIQWKVASANKQGYYTLAQPLQPGKGVFLSGVLGSGIEAGKPCTAVKI